MLAVQPAVNVNVSCLLLGREVRLLRELRDQAQEEASRLKITLAELQVSKIARMHAFLAMVQASLGGKMQVARAGAT